MCSICPSRSGQAPVARSSSRLHKQIPSFTMSISRIHRPIRRRTTSQKQVTPQGAKGKGASGKGGKWWSQTGSNRRPEACKATALPTELWPRPKPDPRRTRPPQDPRAQRSKDQGIQNQSAFIKPHGSNRRGPATMGQAPILVGLGRFELPTSRLSSARSNQLSYRPSTPSRAQYRHPHTLLRPREKEKRGRRMFRQ